MWKPCFFLKVIDYVKNIETKYDKMESKEVYVKGKTNMIWDNYYLIDLIVDYLNPKRAEFTSAKDETTTVSCMLTTSALFVKHVTLFLELTARTFTNNKNNNNNNNNSLYSVKG